jgi:SAM-dependent MidA family methyltransferase
MALEPGPARDLTERLRRRIADEGPITFAAFMEAALYDPHAGFYRDPPVGRRGAFVTSPHVSPAFGKLLARQVDDLHRLLGRPDPFVLIELGAGDGTLARQILPALPNPTASAIRYVAVERSEGARRALEEAGLAGAERLEDLPRAPAGVVLANEVFDNLPFHRLRVGSEGLRELMVEATPDGFRSIEGSVSDPALATAVPADLPPGREFLVSPASSELVRDALSRFVRGYLLIVDYGFADPLEERSVHGYRGHERIEDILDRPGTTDITAGVDFTAILAAARARGARTWGPVSQRDGLLALGFREWEEAAREEQVTALNERRGLDALHRYAERGAAGLLVARGGLGDFLMACAGVGVEDETPRFATGPRGER